MFSLTRTQREKLNDWLENKVYPSVIESHKEISQYGLFTFTSSDGVEMPYSGAIGGDVTYCFTPTSLGTITKVQSWGFELDLTEYDKW